MGIKASTVAQSSNGQSSATGGSNEASTLQEFSLLRSLPGAIRMLQQHQQGNQSQSPRVAVDSRQRARSLSSVPDLSSAEQNNLATSVGVGVGQALGLAQLDSDDADEDGGRGVYAAHSLPSHIWSLNGLKCPVCSKFILPDDIECHLVMCLTKPRLSYNEDVLSDEKGECAICLEELQSGDVIARLPCLCIYHKNCIDSWFQVNRCCPEHPGD